LAVKVTANGTSIFCGEEGWEEEDGAGLLISQRVDSKKQLSTPADFRCFRKHWDKEGVHEDGFEVGLQ